MADKVLVVDDDERIVNLLRAVFESNGYEVFQALNGTQGLKEIFNHQPDIALIDIMMPLMDGYTLCQRIREVSDIPIIIVSARVETVSTVQALTIGADDYITKPFSVSEIVARVGAALRRSRLPPVGKIERYSDGFLELDLPKREVLVGGMLLSLTPAEFTLLAALVQNRDKIMTWRQLFDALELQGTDAYNVLKWHVFTLRRKLEKNPSNPQRVVTVRGIGYRYVAPSF